jgi:hypothetical protein
MINENVYKIAVENNFKRNCFIRMIDIVSGVCVAGKFTKYKQHKPGCLRLKGEDFEVEVITNYKPNFRVEKIVELPLPTNLTNEITIDPEKIRMLPDNSVTDFETIRQIALWSIKMNDNSLNDKIRKEFHFAGLYPHVMKIHNELPENLRKDESSSI